MGVQQKRENWWKQTFWQGLTISAHVLIQNLNNAHNNRFLWNQATICRSASKFLWDKSTCKILWFILGWKINNHKRFTLYVVLGAILKTIVTIYCKTRPLIGIRHANHHFAKTIVKIFLANVDVVVRRGRSRRGCYMCWCSTFTHDVRFHSRAEVHGCTLPFSALLQLNPRTLWTNNASLFDQISLVPR